MQLGFMSEIPVYSQKEIKWYNDSKKEHILCDKLKLENYVLRLIKNWAVNFSIVAVVVLLIKYSSILFASN